ncbi:MAG: glycosyltransferase family 2 protein [Rhodoferax sp.]|nr:glycosyltransferase family 2 protein [Rhodoferax sp.]
MFESQAPSGNQNRIYVVLLNWNGAADTLNCLQSLLQIQTNRVDYVVCDNASSQKDFTSLQTGVADFCTANSIRLQCFESKNWPTTICPANGPKNLFLIQTGSNLGFAGGVNVGLRFAQSRGDLAYAWILNNDCEISSGALETLVSRSMAEQTIGICGSTLVYHGDRSRVQALGGARYLPWRGRSLSIGAFSAANTIPTDPTRVERQLDYVVGASMLVSRKFLDVVGLMDERYFLYSEEHDWAHRGRQAGFTLGWAPDSVVFHKHGASIGSSASGGSPLSMFYLFRSKVLFTSLHFRRRLPVVLMSLAMDALKFALKGHPSKTWAALRGMLSYNGPARF